MINWAQVTGFDWDEGNSRKNAAKHGVSQSEAEEIFFNEPLLVLEDESDFLVIDRGGEGHNLDEVWLDDETTTILTI